MSTYGARRRMFSPSWLATQPPTPITSSGRASLSSRHMPSSEYTLSSAFSLIEQVLSNNTSASSALSTSARPCEAASTSDILAESYSNNRQPKDKKNSNKHMRGN